MGEGQLCKRLYDLICEGYYYETHIPLNGVRKLIGEAKKEFPQKNDYVTGTYVFGETTFHGREAYEKAVQEWFVRWFCGETVK